VVVQRGARVALRGLRRRERANPRLSELAATRPAAGHQGGPSAAVRDSLRHDHKSVLSRRSRHELLASPLPLLLFAAGGLAGKVLPRVSQACRNRPDRLSDVARCAEYYRRDRVSKEMGSVCNDAESELTTA